MMNQHRIVSSEGEELILVDSNDREIGSISKAEAHDGEGVLHRAFSLFLFNDDGELLLQQRAPGKRLWGGYWSNSCCSHPRLGESLEIATSRRLRDELNFDTRLEHVYWFCYQASYDDAGAENELCHVYLGRASDEVQTNDSEIAALRYLSPAALDAEFEKAPERYTPWFKQEWQELKLRYREQLERYCTLD
ncbi:MAG: isopentenyl-diphosphate Delta-isomerase [Gammaproteobacteria bacterium]|nr:isopentenyl-diphosphate Delta-isomerase [Gammaproteobacteria bacterium]NNF48762.1 isopentenyl-diphosphate Delta-isomerase [Woeseiaceae bacterium]MBT8094607.1 isopentenyl-diphosphate Delta-isomerase [Gammaproteobacteria bacterium]MBT8106372.1 isopentenyl-diphosphate Delta-isomerase [Gammaproteobacteria bacterium]NNK26387.1 isopentenyl-diphosphate Delta-isomerase [Woeseiaceae bacterium]